MKGKGSIIQITSLEKQIQIFKALSHPARIAILEILRDGEHCVCHLEAYLELRQAYISQQLSVLREAGMIEDCRDGWHIYYNITDPRIFNLLDIVYKITDQDAPDITRKKVQCSCPRCSPED